MHGQDDPTQMSTCRADSTELGRWSTSRREDRVCIRSSVWSGTQAVLSTLEWRDLNWGETAFWKFPTTKTCILTHPIKLCKKVSYRGPHRKFLNPSLSHLMTDVLHALRGRERLLGRSEVPVSCSEQRKHSEFLRMGVQIRQHPGGAMCEFGWRKVIIYLFIYFLAQQKTNLYRFASICYSRPNNVREWLPQNLRVWYYNKIK